MRFAALLASLAVAAIHPALAADPAGAQAAADNETSSAVRSPVAGPAVAAPAADPAPATATPTSAAATVPPAAQTQTDSDAAQLEKRMRAKGYAIHMENGEKVFCRREQLLGSRLGGALHCLHADEARVSLIQSDEEQLRMRMMMGCVPSRTPNGQPVANCGN